MSTLNINAADELYLPWVRSASDRRFRKILLFSIIIFSVFGTIISLLDVPPPIKKDLKTVSPRLAALVMQRRKLPPPPPPEPVKKKVKKKVKPKPKAKPKVKPKKKTVEKKKPVKTKEDAMKKAASSGLVSMAAELNDLRDSFDISDMDDSSLSKAGKTQKQDFNRSVITSGAMQSSGGIRTSQLSSSTGGGKLNTRTTTNVSSNIDTGPSKRVKRNKNGRTVRPQYEIEQVFQKNKSAIYSIYNRELRKDPTLQGKVVVELTIGSNGKVIKARIVSSDLNNPKLERKLIRRVKMFRFKPGKMGKVTVKYPIDFLPS